MDRRAKAIQELEDFQQANRQFIEEVDPVSNEIINMVFAVSREVPPRPWEELSNFGVIAMAMIIGRMSVIQDEIDVMDVCENYKARLRARES